MSRHVVATNYDAARGFYQGTITLSPLPDGSFAFALGVAESPAAAHRFDSAAIAATFAANLTELCRLLPGHARTWFAFEQPEPPR
jgi:hypothetical protein